MSPHDTPSAVDVGRRPPLRIVGIDPGLASLGLAVLEWDGAQWRLSQDGLRVVGTRKSPRKQRIRATDDNVRRAREIGVLLEQHCGVPGVAAVCAEALSFPRSASVAAKVALVWGVLAEMTRARGLALLQSTPQEVKRAGCGCVSASKEDVQAAMCARFPEAGPPLRALGARAEHAADALAAAVACLETDQVRLLLGAIGREATT
jgi:Holliday junction resolvasome RuvABC endonuclease subunit